MVIEYRIKTLSGRGKDITYNKTKKYIEVQWGETSFKFEYKIYSEILNNFFSDADKWYLLGASMTDPIKGGLGEFVSQYPSLSPRHASAIAAIMVNEGDLNYRGSKLIELKKS